MICAAVDIIDNHAHTVWSRENTLDLQTTDWGTALREWLRDQALQPDVPRAEALVKGFNQSAGITRITVDQYGTSQAHDAAPADWDQVTNPASGSRVTSQSPTALSAPEPDLQQTLAETDHDGSDSAEASSTPNTLPVEPPEPDGPGDFAIPGPLAPVPDGSLTDSPAPTSPVEPVRIVVPKAEADTTPARPQAPRHSAESFLTVNRVEEPATQGWRGALNHVGFHLAPSASEKAHRDDIQAVSQHWPGPRTIVVVNQKGGANKTPTAILLAAVFAQFGGAGVNAWDTNQLQGTLGWRTEQGPHEATAADLLAHADQLLGTEAQSADLARFVHHQTADKFDVLRAQPLLRDASRRLTPDQITLIHQVLGKYYRVVVADTSNDPSDPAWLQLMGHADQLVVATTTSDDRAEAGRLLLDDLESSGGHDAELAAGAVTVVSQADQKAPKSELKRIASGYRELTRAVVEIPYDPAMVSGWLRWGALASQTRRAWLAAGAAVAAGL